MTEWIRTENTYPVYPIGKKTLVSIREAKHEQMSNENIFLWFFLWFDLIGNDYDGYNHIQPLTFQFLSNKKITNHDVQIEMQGSTNYGRVNRLFHEMY